MRRPRSWLGGWVVLSRWLRLVRVRNHSDSKNDGTTPMPLRQLPLPNEKKESDNKYSPNVINSISPNVKIVNVKILDLGAIILTFILVPSATIKLSPLFGFQNVLGKLSNALKGGEIQNFDHLKNGLGDQATKRKLVNLKPCLIG